MCGFEAEAGNTGTMIIYLKGDRVDARTILPDIDMEISTFDIYCSGPDGVSFEITDFTERRYEKRALIQGEWTITVDARNSEKMIIASGAAVISILANRSTTAEITVEPLEGEGSLEIQISWPPDIVEQPSVSCSLSSVSGEEMDFSCHIEETYQSCYGENQSLEAGYYLLSIKLYDGNTIIWGSVETVRIIKESATQGGITLDMEDFKAYGNIDISLTPNLENPIEITFSGRQSVLEPSTDMTVTAVTSESVDSIQWYLDGEELKGETEHRIVIGSGLSAGTYHLDCVVKKNNVMSSSGFSFSIAPASIHAMIAQFDETELYSTILDLQNFGTRVYGTSGNENAATYLFEKMEHLQGLEVEYQGGDYRNIIATLPPENSESSSIYMIGAHYDSISTDINDAPGATDNGCGVALVCEIARILVQYQYNHTVVFAFWNEEEHNCQGSRNYVADAVLQGTDFALYINLDSSGYDPNERYILDLMYNSDSAWAAELFASNNSLYDINFTLTHNVFSCTSDYVPFRDAGYATIMTHCEEHGPAHSPNDTIDKVSIPYAKKNAQLCLSVLAGLLMN